MKDWLKNFRNPFTEKYDRIEGYWFTVVFWLGFADCGIFMTQGRDAGLIATGLFLVLGIVMGDKADKRARKESQS